MEKRRDLVGAVNLIQEYGRLKREYGSAGVDAVLDELERSLGRSLSRLRRLPVDGELARREPNDLAAILRLRPRGPRRMWPALDLSRYRERLQGALLGRFAGCTLGAPVECWPMERMQRLAQENGEAFPPTDYWKRVPDALEKRYQVSPRASYTRAGLDGVPVDDDLAYTVLGLLVAEKHGPKFSTAQVGESWLKYLPYACTAEEVALRNLRAGVPAEQAAERDNPYCEWIGADIRADPWGYLAPGWPERAARMAYRDALLSHRRQGIYGAMYFAAAISAAFALEDPAEAIAVGLSEIPRECTLAKAVRWALGKGPEIGGYREAREAVERRFPDMHMVHTIPNACLTVFGILRGGRDLTRVIGETVAMGLDNDCTAATAGSIVGAAVGKAGIPPHWYRRFHGRLYTYLKGLPQLSIPELLKRFTRQAQRVFATSPG
jgi:ADP-ribosylglycohydrolase